MNINHQIFQTIIGTIRMRETKDIIAMKYLLKFEFVF
jgi:hypothetical protein